MSKEHPQKGQIIAVCASAAKGTPKQDLGQGVFIAGHGLAGDAHAGAWHRQVSLLSWDKIEAFRARGAEVADGAFGENLIVAGYDFKNLPVGTRFRSGSLLLEMTQIGKECHHGCVIFQTMGDCIMPREGVFCRVLHGGAVQAGDILEIVG